MYGCVHSGVRSAVGTVRASGTHPLDGVGAARQLADRIRSPEHSRHCRRRRGSLPVRQNVLRPGRGTSGGRVLRRRRERPDAALRPVANRRPNVLPLDPDVLARTPKPSRVGDADSLHRRRSPRKRPDRPRSRTVRVPRRQRVAFRDAANPVRRSAVSRLPAYPPDTSPVRVEPADLRVLGVPRTGRRFSSPAARSTGTSRNLRSSRSPHHSAVYGH
jgi:hypothetical protein